MSKAVGLGQAVTTDFFEGCPAAVVGIPKPLETLYPEVFFSHRGVVQGGVKHKHYLIDIEVRISFTQK